jgi:hypothetical protein
MGKAERLARRVKRESGPPAPLDTRVLDEYVARLGLEIDREEQSLWMGSELTPIDRARFSQEALLAEAVRRIERVLNTMSVSAVQDFRSTASFVASMANSGLLSFGVHRETRAVSGQRRLMTVYPEARGDDVHWVISIADSSIFNRFNAGPVGLTHEKAHLERMLEYQLGLPSFLTAEEQVEDVLEWFNSKDRIVDEEVIADTKSTRAYIEWYGLGVRDSMFSDDAVVFARQNGEITQEWRDYIGAKYDRISEDKS